MPALLSTLVLALVFAGTAFAAEPIPPVVSTKWLADAPVVVIVDVRASGYDEGHIPGSLSIPGFLIDPWSIATPFATPDPTNGLWMEFPTADATRVAITLIYAGVKNVAILDGGFPQWVADGLPVTTAVPVVTPVQPHAVVPPADMVVGTEYVLQRIGKSIIIDAWDQEVYRAQAPAPEPWTPTEPGHIPTAVSLPAPLIWETDGAYRAALML
ncbi:MAG: hypothetical protein LLG45_11540 [Actinomycetia bacterium]|nr:hypothetical protein [Actinomycetes bacterium]